MATYRFEVFGKNSNPEDDISEQISDFRVRIQPPVPELSEDFFRSQEAGYVSIGHYATTAHATILSISAPSGPYEESIIGAEFLTHEERVEMVLPVVRDMIDELNAIDNPASTTWADGEFITG